MAEPPPRVAWASAALLFLPLACASKSAATPASADVLVFGASSAGVAAAVAAARTARGVGVGGGGSSPARVVLVATAGHVGGATTSGLGCVDAGNGSTVGGFARELYTRLGRVYGLPNGTAAWRVTPGAARRVLEAMLHEAGVEVVRWAGTPTRCAAASGGSGGSGGVVRWEMSASNMTAPLLASVLVDGTYEGDLAAACGVSVTWGREAASRFGEANAGVLPEPSPLSAGHCQFNVDVDPLDTSGRLLPQIPSSAPPTGAPGGADGKVMAYTFRLCVTNRSDIRVPFERPEGYDPAHWELLARFTAASKITSAAQLMWRFPLPGGKFDVCNYGPLSTMPVGLQWGWPNGTASERALLWEAHRRHVAGFLYFLASDLRVPEPIRADVSSFGLCGDEFADTPGHPHWPPEVYVREARRVVGARVFTEHDRARPCGAFRSVAVGLGGFWFDSVVVDRAVYPGNRLLNEGNYNAYAPKAPFDLPYWLLLNRPGGPPLLSPTTPSASHVGFSSLRLEPTLMALGHAAGAAAALASAAGVTPDRVDVTELQRVLRAQGARVFEEDLRPDDWVPCGVV